MTSRLFLCICLFTISFINAQSIDEKRLMGEWEVVEVTIPNAENIPQKEAIKFMEDAFLGAKFNFEGNHIFRIEFGTKADDRIEELFALDNTNWILDKGLIKIGTKGDGFSGMEINSRVEDDQVFFILPVIVMKMNKLSDAIPAEAKWIEEDEFSEAEPTEDSKSEPITKPIDKSDIIAFNEAENPPLAPKCKATDDTEAQRKCTSTYINRHLMRKFNTDLFSKVDRTGKIRIKITFLIDKQGKAINIEATDGPDILTEHAIEILNKLPKLTPATKDGEPINVSYKMPFVLMIAD